MSVLGVRVGRCDLCGWSCNGTRCPAHSDCGEDGDTVWIDLHIADLLSPPGLTLDRSDVRGYGLPMDAAEQREAVQPSRERVA